MKASREPESDKMTDQEFIDNVYELAFGEDARTRLPKDLAYEHEEVLEKLKEFEQWSLKWEEQEGVGSFA